ncbi:MAG: GTPase HflX [Bacteroidales bacterium]
MLASEIKPEKAVLVGIVTGRQDEDKVHDYLDELEFLLETAGAIPGKRFVQKLPMPDPRTLVGAGKLQEIAEYVKAEGIDVAVFDDELSGSQTRNIERELGCRVLDRPLLILDIFAKRARTTTARTQVELAQYQYLLPRLTRMWTHLEKQRGGIGMRGPGEKEIETDRRIIRDKIALLKEKLKDIDKQKITQRKNREELIRVALVGYTNAGKSTIMNMLSKSEVLAENKLFATLDTTVRKMVIENLPFLLTDTVGFIRKLPHNLVESFKSTLDEVREADLLVHVVDISHASFEEQVEIANQTLAEIGCADKPSIMVFNKIDAYTHVEKDPFDLAPPTRENITLQELENTWMARLSAPALFISAKQKINIDEFRKLLYEEVKRLHVIRYPYNNFLY